MRARLVLLHRMDQFGGTAEVGAPTVAMADAAARLEGFPTNP
jgi:hypothetical protein